MSDTDLDTGFKIKIGQRVSHPVYGRGTVIAVENSIKMGDNNNWDKSSQSSIVRTTNGTSGYSGHLNIAVKFDNGGPQGFAINASNEAGLFFPNAENVLKILTSQVGTWRKGNAINRVR